MGRFSLSRGGAYGAASSPSPSDDIVLLNVGPPEGTWPRDPSNAQGRAFQHEEHDLGDMLHGSRVVDIGAADASFAREPKEADGAENEKG